MAEQYWVGGFFIDLSRNQITQNKNSQTIPPKALAVLTCLAENQGTVVSQETLLAKVWRDTVVSPNTLQRSIAQLRKALGDDGKGQVYIKTHSKQGYSLECDVRWHDRLTTPDISSHDEIATDKRLSVEDSDTVRSVKAHQISRPSWTSLVIVTAIIFLCVTAYHKFHPKQGSQLTVDALRSLTATDDKEYDASYTPDGKYVVFHRYLDKQCGNKLWAKERSSQKEIQLTRDWAAYGRHSFSNDGKKLVFLATEACSAPVTQTDCYNLLSLDFEKALDSPQQPSVILQCKNSLVRKPVWLDDDHIALLQNNSNRWELIRYSISKNESTDLYDLQSGSIVDFAYSVVDELIAVVSVQSDGQHYLEMLKPDGQILFSNPIERVPEIPKHSNIYPSFDPKNNRLIFSTGRQLFTLSYHGKTAKINLPFTDRMVQPVFHPDGKRLLLIKGSYDSDIVMFPLDQIDQTTSSTPSSNTASNKKESKHSDGYERFERSNLGEDYAIFQPGGDLVAFWSERSGGEQLWISGNNGPRQLTNFPVDTSIRGIDWAADGKSLLVNANGVLTRITLDSRQEIILWEHPVARLYQWDSKNNSALLHARINGIMKLVEVDLGALAANNSLVNNTRFREITNTPVLWALKSASGQLIYKDHLDQFWRPGPAEARLIEPLKQHGGKSKSFIIDGEIIYAINDANQLWSYNLDTDTLNILAEVNQDIDYLTDVSQSQSLMTIRVSSKKEVVELTLND